MTEGRRLRSKKEGKETLIAKKRNSKDTRREIGESLEGNQGKKKENRISRALTKLFYQVNCLQDPESKAGAKRF